MFISVFCITGDAWFEGVCCELLLNIRICWGVAAPTEGLLLLLLLPATLPILSLPAIGVNICCGDIEIPLVMLFGPFDISETEFLARMACGDKLAESSSWFDLESKKFI